MSLADDLLNRAGLKYEDLNKEEKATLHRMLESVQKNKVTVESIRDYVHSMKDAVEAELTEQAMKKPSFWSFIFNFRRDYQLKARLRNYMLFEAFLDTPKRAKQAIEQALSGVGRTTTK